MFKILNNQSKLETLNFPDGESFIKFDFDSTRFDLVWYYENDAELVKLAQIVDMAWDGYGCELRNLYIPYFPHARQDRATTKNQPYSLRVFCGLLKNILHLTSVNILTLDIHSDAIIKDNLLGLNLNNKYVYESANHDGFYGTFFSLSPTSFAMRIHEVVGKPYDYIVRPDEGAERRTLEWVNTFNQIYGYKPTVIKCQKHRDPATGQLGEPIIPDIDLTGNRLLIVDDIGTGFGTHILLGKALRKKFESVNPIIDLWVSHASFTRGLADVGGMFNKVFTTDSLKGAREAYANTGWVHAFNCLEPTLYFLGEQNAKL